MTGARWLKELTGCQGLGGKEEAGEISTKALSGGCLGELQIGHWAEADQGMVLGLEQAGELAGTQVQR